MLVSEHIFPRKFLSVNDYTLSAPADALRIAA